MKVLSLAGRNMKEVYRDPVPMILGLLMPAVLLLLFNSIYDRTKIEMFSAGLLTPGIIIFGASFLMMFSGMLLAKDRQQTFLLRLLATPLKSRDFILSYLLPYLPLALIQIILCLLIGYFLGAEYANLLLIFIVLLLNAVICISLGTLIGSLCTVNQVSGIGSVVITLVSLFGAVWTPLEIMGDVFRNIAYAMPFAHAVDASRGLVQGAPFSDVAADFYWVLVYALVMTFAAILIFRWRTQPK